MLKAEVTAAWKEAQTVRNDDRRPVPRSRLTMFEDVYAETAPYHLESQRRRLLEVEKLN